MAAATRSLYVYYRVSRVDEASAVAAVRAMQRRLCARLPGLQAQVLRRAAADDAATDPGDEPTVTLMEVYTAPQGIDASCEAEVEIEAAQLPFATPATVRRLELFEACG